MGFLITAFNEVLYRPLFNALVLLYEYVPGADFGIAIIILTVLIKLLFYPLGTKSIKSQKSLSEIQPKIKEIQEKYKDDKEKQTRETLELYKREKISPFSGCLPLLIQLPVLIAMYRVFWGGLDPSRLSLLYSFVPSPGEINAIFLGFIDLSKSTSFIADNGVKIYLWQNIILVLLVGIAQFLQIRFITPKTKKKASDFSSQMQKQMMYFMPAFMVVILWRLPSALALYIITTTIFTIIQQYVITKKKHVESR
jgi:YidC/Oxa1 family membrane protein insertase